MNENARDFRFRVTARRCKERKVRFNAFSILNFQFRAYILLTPLTIYNSPLKKYHDTAHLHLRPGLQGHPLRYFADLAANAFMDAEGLKHLSAV